MSVPSTVKRRRLDNDANILKRPFVSPLKNNAARTPLKTATRAIATSYKPSTLAHTIPAQSPGHEKKSLSVDEGYTPVKSTPIRNTVLNPSTGRKKRHDPAELALQKSLTRLEMQIRAVRTDLDSLKQAAALRSSHTDADLENLSLKWRTASQTAAEELFGTVKERVNRMGGVVAWRESEKRKYDRAHGLDAFAEDPAPDDDADCEFDSQGEELPEAEQEWRKKLKKKAKEEAMDAAETMDPTHQEKDVGKVSVWKEDGADDDAFTVDMMLRSLNIELDVIGWDKAAQRWVC